jgi:hypothetical protein
MLKVLLYAIPIVLVIYSIVDCLQTPDTELRGLPRLAWLVLILVFPIAGSVAWLLAGRARGGATSPRLAWPTGPTTGGTEVQRPARRIAPDDDPEFLSQLGRRNSAHDALLDEWERDLRGRESDLRGDDSKPTPGDGPPDEAGPSAESGGGKPRA